MRNFTVNCSDIDRSSRSFVRSFVLVTSEANQVQIASVINRWEHLLALLHALINRPCRPTGTAKADVLFRFIVTVVAVGDRPCAELNLCCS